MAGYLMIHLEKNYRGLLHDSPFLSLKTSDVKKSLFFFFLSC